MMHNKKDNIILVGMPGAGKSTVGVVLAKVCGYQFVDSDLVIQEKYEKLLHELITLYGTDGFLKIEEEVNASIMTEKAVIATGGSVIYGPEAMKHFQEIGSIVYLQLSCETIAERLGDLNERGVTLKDGQTLEDLYQERVPLYERYADYVVKCEGKEIREIVADIYESILA